MEYQLASGINRPRAARLSLALSSVLHDPPIDTQRGVLKASVPRELPQAPSSRQAISTKIPVHEPWSLNSKLTPLRFAGREAAPADEANSFKVEEFIPRDPSDTSTLDTHPYSHYSASSHDRRSSECASSTTTIPAHISLPLHYSNIPETSQKPEKTAKLKQIYKRASKSTKALARMLSISRGTSKRSSLKPPVPGVSSSSASDPLPRGSTPNRKKTLSVDVRSRLKRSLSVSSPLGIPSPPLLSRFIHQQSGQKNVRGRDIPFPLTPSVASLPLPPRRTWKNFEESQVVTSTDTPRNQSTTNNQGKYPTPHVVPSSRTSLGARLTPPPEIPLPAAPISALAPAPVHASRTTKQTKSRNIREFEPLRYKECLATETSPRHRRIQEQQNQRQARLFIDESHINDGTTSLPGYIATGRETSPPQSIPASRSRIGDEPSQEGIEIISPVPSSSPPSVTAAFLDWDASKFKEVGVEKARHAGGRQARVAAVHDVSSTSFVRSPDRTQKVEGSVAVPLPPPVVGGLSERRNAQNARDPSRTTPRVGPTVLPPLSITTQSNKTPFDSKDNTHHSIPRSPSLPSLRSDFTSQVPLSQTNANSYYEEQKVRPGILKGTAHVRSPSLPIFPSTNNVQPLPPSVVERLRSRASSSRSEDGRRPNAESSHPSLAKSSVGVKPYSSSDSLPNILSTSVRGSPQPQPQELRAPPPPALSRLLQTRTRQLRASELEAAKFRSPSLPDLHSTNPQAQGRVFLGSQSQSRCANSPPPPVPQIRASPVPQIRTSPVPALLPRQSAQQNTTPASSDSSPIVTASRFLRPRPNLRMKVNSYSPMTVHPSTNFQARSNKELAEEGGWDFMDSPPRPLRSSVMIPATPVTPVDGHGLNYHHQHRQQDQKTQSQTVVLASNTITASPVSGPEGEGEWMVGEAL